VAKANTATRPALCRTVVRASTITAMVTVRSPDADAGSLRGNSESAATTPTRYVTASIVRKTTAPVATA